MLDMNAPAGVLVKTTLVDFPGRVACAFFLAGCNLRCPYCYNTDLVNNHNNDFISVNQLFEHLEKRKNVLSGLVVSGGEALLSPYLPEIFRKAKKLGYKLKLDTNGMFPEKLSNIISSKDTKPDYIAMDIKTEPEKYSLLTQNESEDCSKIKKKLSESIAVISEYPPEQREFRTVLVPGLVTAEDIKKMAQLLPEDSFWYFARFQNQKCLDPHYETILPYSDLQANELVKTAKQIIQKAELR